MLPMLAALAVATPAWAQTTPEFPIKVESHEVLPGALETVVEIRNTRDVALAGRVELTRPDDGAFAGSASEPSAEAPFALGPRAIGRVLLTPTVGDRYSIIARVVLADGSYSTELSNGSSAGRYGFQGQSVFVDLGGHAGLLGALNDAQVPMIDGTRETVAAVAPSATSSGYTPLPTTLGGYSSSSLVHLGSRQFLDLSPAELTALVDFVAHGGTVAFSVDDTAHLTDPKILALLGGRVYGENISAEAFGDAAAVTRQTADGNDDGALVSEPTRSAPAATGKLTAYSGGNTVGSPYGSIAAYGLGRVVMLPFHAARVTENPWAVGKLAELTIDSTRHRKTSFSQIAPQSGIDETKMQHALDPNQRFRGTLGIATALLLGYAGFVAWRLLRDQKQRRMFRSFVWLPALAASLTLCIVGLGFVSRGSQRGVRRVLLLEGGAGFGLVSVDEYRGYFTSGSEPITLSSHTPRSLLYAAALGPVHQRDGFAFLRDKPRLPWQTTITRELRMEQSEQEISLGEVDDLPWVTNRTLATLEDVVLTSAAGLVYVLPRVDPGQHALATKAQCALSTGLPTSGALIPDAFTDLSAAERERLTGRYDVLGALSQQRTVHPVGTTSLLARTRDGAIPFARTGEPASPWPMSTVATFVHVVGVGGAP